MDEKDKLKLHFYKWSFFRISSLKVELSNIISISKLIMPNANEKYINMLYLDSSKYASKIGINSKVIFK